MQRLLKSSMAVTSKFCQIFRQINRACGQNELCSSLTPSGIILPDISRRHSTFSNRSHTCGQLGSADIGQEVTLCGWVQYLRHNMFVVLRDAYGITQLVLPREKDTPLNELLSSLKYETVIEIKGVVQARLPGQENKKLPTGDIEVDVKEVKVLNERRKDLPFEIKEFHEVKEPLRLEYRYLDLRHSKMQSNLRLRSQMVMKMREFLCNKHGFVDVETPTLFRKTPGGAREFIVPTKHPGKFYSLPQSPQQFKQLLMVGGIDRYMQIARCYRDESHRPDRQPEFTQLDIEMSFINQEGIQKLTEELIEFCWPDSRRKSTIPFPKLTYQEAMMTYGTDKPDTRFEMKLCDITSTIKKSGLKMFADILNKEGTSVQAFNIKQGNKHFKKKDYSEMLEISSSLLGGQQNQTATIIRVRDDGTWQSPLTKHLSEDAIGELTHLLQIEPNDTFICAAGDTTDTCKLLGKIRLKAADLLEDKGVHVRDHQVDNFLWVEDFPLFLPKEDEDGNHIEGLESAHHPFTAAHPDDDHMVKTHPEQVRSQHYDLVLNGWEIGGGSIRIHDADLQRYVLEEILKEDASQLKHLLEALEFGCPPHGGIALGLDRVFAIVCGAKNIRDVIAFPKSLDGKDLLSKAPAPVSQDEKDYYHIISKDDKHVS